MLVFHRFERSEPMCEYVCTPPEVGLTRPDYACQGCGVIVTDEELHLFGLRVGEEVRPTDTNLSLVIAARVERA